MARLDFCAVALRILSTALSWEIATGAMDR